jgi:hypothetical protein
MSPAGSRLLGGKQQLKRSGEKVLAGEKRRERGGIIGKQARNVGLLLPRGAGALGRILPHRG